MRPSSFFGPQLARILRDQRRIGRAEWLAERRAVSFLGGVSMTAGRKVGFGSTVRASTSFGLRGGELCDCRGADCGSCRSIGEDAPPWAHLGWRLRAGMAAAPAMRCAAGKMPPPPDPPVRIVDPRSESLIDAIGIGIGWRDPTAGPYVDIHSHNLCAGDADWTGDKVNTRQRLMWLYELRAEGIDKMAISGLVDDPDARGPGDPGTGDPDFIRDERLDDITGYAADLYWDFFIPFVRTFDIRSSGAPDYVESWLSAGFCGVGEVIVHGHGSSLDEDTMDSSTPLVQVCRVAANYNVPVLVHWDMGNVDHPDIRTAEANYNQLIALLDNFPTTRGPVADGVVDTANSMPLKLILGHCGVGPGDVMLTDDLSAWTTRLDYLLNNYPNVYFDIAGMQIDFVIGGPMSAPACHQLFEPFSREPTPIGLVLLERILMWPTRFLVGIDTENRSDGFADVYANSVSLYDDFLNMGARSAGALDDSNDISGQRRQRK